MSCDEAWAFAQAFYARLGVSSALLRLQDEHGADVPLILVLLHAARRGVLLDADAVGGLMRIALAWSREVVAPLRQARRSIKAATYDTPEGLYEQAKAVEQSAEQVIIRQLAATLPAHGTNPPDLAAAANLETYRILQGLPEGSLDPIAAAFAADPGRTP